jgi:pyruvate dehydrogenase E2 component (dihydrolipoamide acetyltransferase)
MASVLTMPRLSDTMETGVLVKWHKKQGDKVEPGQVLAEIETDKAIQEFESFEKGVLLKLLVGDGDKVAVGAPIAVIGEAGEDVSAELAKLGAPASTEKKAPAPAKAAPAAPSVAAPAAPVTSAPAAAGPQAVTPDGRVLASPVARKIAREADINLATVAGSGPNGRIIRKDVEAALEAKANQPVVAAPVHAEPAAFKRPSAWETNGESHPASQMRKTIARRLLEAKTTIPHFYLTVEIDMDEAVKFRALVHEPDAGNPVSYNDLVIKACAVALSRFPEAHAAWEGDSIRRFAHADISVAVSTEEGLITPVIRHADQKSLGAIAKEMRVLAEKARNKKLKPEEFTGGTFSISNLGMFGIEEFCAIINPPEACILAVGSIEKKPVVKNDALTIGHRMRVTLSCDHRVVDGVLGAKLLQEIKATLEKPMRLAL